MQMILEQARMSEIDHCRIKLGRITVFAIIKWIVVINTMLAGILGDSA